MMNGEGNKSGAEPPSLDNLPSDLVDAVLVRMPLRDAVRTSILSRQWRYKWTTMTTLHFGERHWNFNSESTNSHFSTFVDRVLMRHVGPILSFKITVEFACSSITPSDVDHWLIYLSTTGIKKLALALGLFTLNYTVHSSVFYCQSLTFLCLIGCTVKLPRFFDGFANLSYLLLRNVRVSAGDLRSLISNCALLGELVLDLIVGCNCVKISGPRLRYLFLKGEFTDFSLTTTPVLSDLSIELLARVDVDHLRNGGICNLSRILACANSIKKLELCRHSSKFMAAGCKPEKLRVVFERLQSLRLNICFTDTEQVALLLSLLRSSPCLRELKLSGGGYRYAEIMDKTMWETSEDMDVFGHLRFVDIIDFSCLKSEMKFIQYVLAHAPVLQRMKINGDAQPGKAVKQVLIQLLGFERASRQAKIIYIE